MPENDLQNTSSSSPARTASTKWAWIGGAALALAALLSLHMALSHASGIGLPGCGPGTACARAAASRWGSVPGLGWPMSYVGGVFFAALTAAWFAGCGRVGGTILALIRLGIAASVFFVVVSIGERLWCGYCLAIHAANTFAWLASERVAPPSVSTTRQPRRPLLTFAVTATLAAAALTTIEWRARRAGSAAAERSLGESTAQLREGVPGSSGRFSGRYLLGPENARVRIVIFTDYQCPDCRLLETQSDALLKSRADVSLSIMHFPFCTECNPRAERTLHANACRAARAAEAAGALGGADGFWTMHRWLFDRAGAFDEAQLRAALTGMGFDQHRFAAEMSSDRTRDHLRADIDRAFSVGLNTTPMVFVNGVELKGWSAPDALTRAADAAAQAPVPASDLPPDALAKLVQEWLAQARSNIPPAVHPWVRGSTEPRVRIVLFGDYQEPNCAAADGLLRKLTASRPGTSYEFRHFPLNPACNPIAQSVPHPMACRMAAAAEAAGAAGGDAAFWAAHDYIFSHQRTFNDHALQAVLRPIGVDIKSIAQASATPQITGRILADCRSAEAVGVTGVPLIFVNDRRVPRWTYGELAVMEAILDRAESMP